MNDIFQMDFDDEAEQPSVEFVREKTQSSFYVECEFEQRTPEWNLDRLAIPTGTGYAKIITTKGKKSTQAEDYMFQLLADWKAGEDTSGYRDFFDTNEDIKNGRELEPEARELYSFITDNKVREINFCFLNDKKETGVSPDGGVTEKGSDTEEGGVEIKCVKGKTLMKWKFADKIPTTYFQQIQGQMWVMGWQWVDFFAYHPKCGHFLKRMNRDDDFITALAKEVHSFNLLMKEKREVLSDG